MSRRNYSNYYSNKVEEPKAPEEPKFEETYEAPVEVKEDPKPVIKTKTGKVVNCERVNVRSEARLDAAISSIILAGEQVDVDLSKSTADFYSVITDHGIDGFIKKDFLEV